MSPRSCSPSHMPCSVSPVRHSAQRRCPWSSYFICRHEKFSSTASQPAASSYTFTFCVFIAITVWQGEYSFPVSFPWGRGRSVLCDYTIHPRLVRRDSFLPITENGDKRVRCKYNWWIWTFMAALFSTGNKVAAKFFKNGEFCKLLLYRVIENSYFFGLQKLRVVAPKPKLSGAKS